MSKRTKPDSPSVCALLLVFILSTNSIFAEPSRQLVMAWTIDQNEGVVSKDGIWASTGAVSFANGATKSDHSPRRFHSTRLNQKALVSSLVKAPPEFARPANGPPGWITLPMPDGDFGTFRFVESPIMEQALAARFPEIRTYRGQEADDPNVTTRFDWTPNGFHAVVFARKGTFVIEPVDAERGDYISYYQHDLPAGNAFLECLNADDQAALKPRDERSRLNQGTASAPLPNGSTLRTYRVAIGVTAEYTQLYGGGTVSGALSAVTTGINNFNALFEREVSIRLILVGNEASVIYTNTSTDGYTHGNPGQLSNENQPKLDSIIGAGNYDIGHVFDGQALAGNGYGAMGVGALGVVGINGQKARGATEFFSTPPSHPYFAHALGHEMGHQFSALHTFNGTTSICGQAGQRFSSAAYEVGSGSTIMAYGGACGAESLPTQETYYHEISLEQIVGFTTTGAGSASAQLIPTGNNPPIVDAGNSFTIPARTPFTLTATGSDPDGDALTYCWEEFDLGTPSPPNTDDGSRPIFRSFFPISSPSRTFPQLSDVLSGNSTFGESLPTTTRTMKFRATVRDNRTGGGGVNSAQTQVNTWSDAGPFNVTQPASSTQWQAGSMQTVTWNVAGTASSPIDCTSVRILLSVDGGNTFPITLAANVPNSGAAVIRVPNVVTSMARVKVAAVGNIFFNISLPNFTINSDAQINSASIVSAASFDSSLIAPDSISLILGSSLATNSMQAPSKQLPTELLGTKVWVNGIQASLFFVSQGQINFLVPAEVGPGTAFIDVASGNGTLSSGQVMIASTAPGLFTANALGTGAPLGEVTTDGLRYSLVGNSDGSPRPLHNGDYLTLYGTGIRQAGTNAITISIGGVNASVFYAAAEPDLPGLDQVNTRIPSGVTGDVDLVLSINGKTANVVRLRIN